MVNSTKPKLRAAWEKEKEQASLKKQYGIEKPDVVVVERKNVITNALRIILKALAMACRVMAVAAIAVLAVVGLASLIYPNIRTELINTVLQIIAEIRSYF